MKSFLILIDFENLFIKRTISNSNILLFSLEKVILLKTIPNLYFEDYLGVIFTPIEIYKMMDLYIIYRGDHKIEDVLNSYLQGNLKVLDFSYFGVILDLMKKNIVVFGSFFFYKPRYKDSYWIFSDFDLFYKLSDLNINKEMQEDFIKSGKFDIIECENKILNLDLEKKSFKFENILSKRKKVKHNFKSLKLPDKFYYLLDLKDFVIFENLKFGKLPIKVTSLYQIESLYNTSFDVDFSKELVFDVNLRSLIVSNFENFYSAYKFFNLKNWLFDFLFRPVVIYRSLVLYNIFRNVRF